MKNLFRSGLLILTGIFIITSCNQNEFTTQSSEVNLEVYSLLKKTLANDLDQLAIGLRNNKGERSKIAVDVAKNYYGENTKQFDAFNQSVDLVRQSSSTGRVSSQLNLSDFQRAEVDIIVSKTKELSDILEFKEYMNSEFTRYASSDLGIEDKNFMLTFITMFEVNFEFMVSNPDLFQDEISNGRVNGFWGCVVGVVSLTVVVGVTVAALSNPVGWALIAGDWYLIASAGAASVVTIYNEC